MNQQLIKIIDSFAERIEETFGLNKAALIHGSLHVWRKNLDPNISNIKKEFQKEAISILKKIIGLNKSEAKAIVKEFLDEIF